MAFRHYTYSDVYHVPFSGSITGTLDSGIWVSNNITGSLITGSSGQFGSLSVQGLTGSILTTGSLIQAGTLQVQGIWASGNITGSVLSGSSLHTASIPSGLALTGGLTATTGTFSDTVDITKAGIILRLTDGTNEIAYHQTNQWYRPNENADTGTIVFNYVGYQGGTTKFRDFHIYDGKSASVAFFDGSSKLVTLAGGLTVGSTILSDTTNTDAIGLASVTFSDLFLGDGSIIYFGEDQDVTLTHNPDVGLTLNLGLSIGGALAIGATEALATDIIGDVSGGGVQLNSNLKDGSPHPNEHAIGTNADPGHFGQCYADAWNAYSTRLHKQNITVARERNYLESLPPLYEYNVTKSMLKFGLIAEECPEFITMKDNTGRQTSIDLLSLSSLLIGAIKELSLENKELIKRIEILEKRGG